MVVEKARDQRLNEYVPNRQGAKVLDTIKTGSRLIRGSTLKSFNWKTLLKAARYRDPTDTEVWGEVVDNEDFDDIQPMDMDMGSDGE